MLCGLSLMVFVLATVLALPVDKNAEMELESNITSINIKNATRIGTVNLHPTFSSSEEMHDPSVVSGRAVRSASKKSEMNQQVTTTKAAAVAVVAVQKNSKSTTKKRTTRKVTTTTSPTTRPLLKKSTSAKVKPSPSTRRSLELLQPTRPYIEMYDEPSYLPYYWYSI